MKESSEKRLIRKIDEIFEMQQYVTSYEVIDKKQNIINIDGSFEIEPSMLCRGELPFKIGKLTGDLLLYCRCINPSVIPEEVGGNIIFRNRFIGENTLKARFGIGDRVYFINKGKVENSKIKAIKMRIFYDSTMNVKSEISYQVLVYDEPLCETKVFASPKEIHDCILNIPIERSCAFSHTIKYTVGDEAWFIKDDKVYNRPISKVEILVKEVIDGNKSLNELSRSKPEWETSVQYVVDIDGEAYALAETQIWESKKALALRFT